MSTIQALRKRIDTTTDLQGIVRTMKALAAVNIRQYEHAVESLAEYAETVELGLQVVLRGRPLGPAPRAAAAGGTSIVVFGSDYGLCGRFNDGVARHAVETLRTLGVSPDDCRVLAVGMRAAPLLESGGCRNVEAWILPRSIDRVTDTVRGILVQLDAWRMNEGRERVMAFHNRQTEEARAQPHTTTLLPFDATLFDRLAAAPWPTHLLPMYRMDPDRLFAALLRQHLFVSVYRACAESLASENATRLASMQAAEQNIRDSLGEMQGEYRQQRQAEITAELLDVISGFESTARG